MTRVIRSWDIRSTSDIRSNWGYRRTGSDMNVSAITHVGVSV